MEANILVTFLIALQCCFFAIATDVENAFTKNGVVPDIIDVAPPNGIQVIYPNGKEVDLGNVLTPAQVQYQPDVSWEADPDKLYTLLLVDPDALSRKNPIYRSWKHWVVNNIYGSDVSSGETTAEYVSPTPPAGTNYHRYVFLVYEQFKKIKTIPSTARESFNVTEYAKRNRLRGPLAGNLFKARYYNSVRPHSARTP